MAVTKDQLTAQRRGKGGSLVHVPPGTPKLRGRDPDRIPSGVDHAPGIYRVVDLMDRKSFDVPTEVGISVDGVGLATSVRIADVELVTVEPTPSYWTDMGARFRESCGASMDAFRARRAAERD